MRERGRDRECVCEWERKERGELERVCECVRGRGGIDRERVCVRVKRGGGRYRESV